MSTRPEDLPGFRWMPGMLTHTTAPNWTGTVPAGSSVRLDADLLTDLMAERMVGCGGCGWCDACMDGSDPIPTPSIDPSDPATAGCLLFLLGDEAAWRVRAENGTGEWLFCLAGVQRRDPWPSINCLGAACIAVAQSLGRWPGGAE